MRRGVWLGIGLLLCGVWLYVGLGMSKVPESRFVEPEGRIAYVGSYSLPWLPAFRPSVEVTLPELSFLKAPVREPELDMDNLKIELPSISIDKKELVEFLEKRTKPLPKFPKMQKTIPRGLNRIWEGK